jgi:hypothetical protein
MSQGPYWWPDPSQPDGLPYINRDGIRNPESDDNNFDKQRLSQMTEAVMSLTLAWFYTGEADYAKKASELIETWFLDPETAVNPNLKYAQSIPGITEGRGIGIIDTRKYIDIIDAVKLLETSTAWNERMTKRLQDWFSEYLNWLLTSENGKDERAKENNHGSWYDVQVSCYALFTGKTDLAREIISQSLTDRIAAQIDSLGRQKFELSRTNAFSYSVFNLEALNLLSRLAEMAGVDGWDKGPGSSGRIEVACNFLFSYIDRMDEWPYQQIKPIDWSRLIPLVNTAYKYKGLPEYELVLEQLFEKINSNDRLIITNI